MTRRALHRAAAAVLLVATCSLLTPAGAALAHVELDRSEPSAGAVLDTPPAEVFLRFTQDIEEGSFTIRVLDPAGNSVTSGETESGGRAAAVGLARLTDEGTYRVRYRGVAADGHPVDGRLRFRLRFPTVETEADQPSAQATATAQPPTAAPTAAPEALSREPTTVPWWPFALLLGIAALIGIMLFRRR